MSEQTRRRFLGAAAVSAALSLPHRAEAGTPSREEKLERSQKAYDIEHEFGVTARVPPEVVEEARNRVELLGGEAEDREQVDEMVLEQIGSIDLIYPDDENYVHQDPVRGDLNLNIRDDPLFLEDYPDSELSEGAVAFNSFTDGVVELGLESTGEDGQSIGGFMELSADDAEEVAALLREFAAHARNGEYRVYP